MKIKFFRQDVKMPKKSHLPDTGIDIFTPDEFSIEPFETKTIPLGIGVLIPEGYGGMLIPRSSIAEKGLIIQTSAIDPDYTGEIHLIITNCSKNLYYFAKDTRICSLICVNVLNPYLEKVDVFPITERGSSGLGSTGK